MENWECRNLGWAITVCVAVMMALMLWLMVTFPEDGEDLPRHTTSFSVDNSTPYNITVEMYVVMLESDGDAALTRANTTEGWDYLEFDVPAGGQVGTTAVWYGTSQSVTIFTVYSYDMDGEWTVSTSRHIVPERTSYVDLLI